MKPNRPRVGVGVFVKKDGKILLQRRIGAHGAHTWSLPGGHLEYGESPEQTAVREAKEELNVEVANPRVIGLTNDINAGEGKHYITIFVEADYVCGEPKINEPDRTSEIMWSVLDNLPRPLFVPLKNFVENRRLL
jgi:8-oxo-dGTP diphosphatase